MTSWRVARLARVVALRASLLPFALMLVLDTAKDAIPGPVLLDGLYFMVDGLFLGLLLEAMLSRRPLAESLPPLWPPRRVLLFAVAMLPLGLVGGVLSWAARRGFTTALIDLIDDPEALGPFSEVTIRTIDLVISSSTFPLVATGLAVAPVAVHLLELPRIRDAVGRPPSSAPSLGMFGALVLAVLVGLVLEGALGGALYRLPVVGGTALPGLIIWYVADFVSLTLAGGAIATLLIRRAGADAQSQPL
jgi:hypothetical protein